MEENKNNNIGDELENVDSQEVEKTEESENVLETENTADSEIEETSKGFDELDKPEEEDHTDDEVLKIFDEEEGLAEKLSSADLLELVVLIETLSKTEITRQIITNVGLIKRAYNSKAPNSLDEVEDKETKTLISRFQTALSKFNSRKNELQTKVEQRKTELLDALKEIVSKEEVTKIDDVIAIQKEWKELSGLLPYGAELSYKTYKHYISTFYNLRDSYRDLVEQDLKANLDKKLQVIEEIIAITPEGPFENRDEWTKVDAKIKELKEKWRSIGRLPKEDKEEITEKYSVALKSYYDKAKDFFAAQDKIRDENEEKKLALIGKIEKYENFEGATLQEWKKAVDEVLSVQKEWKLVGNAKKSVDNKLWKQFRKICNKFFDDRNEFYKEHDSERKVIMQKKLELTELAESLKDNDNWKETTETLKRIQREWKQLGFVPGKDADDLWKRFRAACNAFFDRKKDKNSALLEEEKENLKKKEALCLEAEVLVEKADEVNIEDVEKLQDEWLKIGQVPIKEKNRINSKFRTLIDTLFDKYEIGEDEDATLSKLKNRYEFIIRQDNADKKLQRESDRLQRNIKELKNKMSSYENNILLIARGKSGDSLRKQIQEKIDAENKRIKEYKKRLKLVKKYRHILSEQQKEEASKEEENVVDSDQNPETTNETPINPEATNNENTDSENNSEE